MDLEEFKGPTLSGVISLVIAVAVTYGVSMVYPTPDLQWALTAVAFASFFSGFFSSYRAEREITY